MEYQLARTQTLPRIKSSASGLALMVAREEANSATRSCVQGRRRTLECLWCHVIGAAAMGRRLNLSHLSQEECERILAVIQRDLELRAREKERLGPRLPFGGPRTHGSAPSRPRARWLACFVAHFCFARFGGRLAGLLTVLFVAPRSNAAVLSAARSYGTGSAAGGSRWYLRTARAVPCALLQIQLKCLAVRDAVA
ncbi:hypothetical protein HPB49_024322 [Dermacentor silvarum]|uniref:Uncharacterized protein n=1 Tax=Dermacentor silvarum TaxID=543639 RepID=A0ACB8DH29_DERSI|nr:hypothetical protein HPB49_024322 [Dermacentor silvarum]